MLELIKNIFYILAQFFKFIENKNNKKIRNIEEDREVADAIKRGNGIKIAEIFKKRKYYKDG